MSEVEKNHDHQDFATRERFGGMRQVFSQAVEDAITKPGRHERPNDPTVWLIWVWGEDEDYTGIPQLWAICTTEYSCRYHVGALLEQNDYKDQIKGQPRSEEWMLNARQRFFVERAPCDHQFGSSLLQSAQARQIRTPPLQVGSRYRYQREGD